MSNVGANGTADLTPPDELVSLVHQNWPWSEWSNALAVSLAESNWEADAEANTVTDEHPCGSFLYDRGGVAVSAERSVSYFQINLCNYPQDRWAELLTPEGNVAEAAELWRQRSWQPWYFTASRLGLL